MADLITLSEYKDHGTISSDTKDGKIALLISGISALIESYCARSFAVSEYTEYHDAKTNVVMLKAFPLVSVTSVKTSIDGGVTQVTLTEAASDKGGYFVDFDNDSIITQVSSYKFLNAYDTSYKSLEVVYEAGYEDIPLDLKLVAIDLVDYYKNNEHKPALALGGASLDNPLPFSGSKFPAHVQRVLDLYRYSA